MKLIDLTGQKFGRLEVICRDFEYQKNKNADKPYWKCRCECGKIISVLGKSLREGNTKSCGCLQKDTIRQLNYKDLTNQKFGKLTAIKYLGNSIWECKCECGNTICVTTHHLTSKHTMSCGCIHSKGEFYITQYLLNNNIPFKKEYTAEDLRNEEDNHLRFDFAILKDNHPVAFIEYNGKQHYDKKDAWYSEKLFLHDNLKKEYAKKKNIPLIIIKFDENIYDKLTQIDFSKFGAA